MCKGAGACRAAWPPTRAGKNGPRRPLAGLSGAFPPLLRRRARCALVQCGRPGSGGGAENGVRAFTVESCFAGRRVLRGGCLSALPQRNGRPYGGSLCPLPRSGGGPARPACRRAGEADDPAVPFTPDESPHLGHQSAGRQKAALCGAERGQFTAHNVGFCLPAQRFHPPPMTGCRLLNRQAVRPACTGTRRVGGKGFSGGVPGFLRRCGGRLGGMGKMKGREIGAGETGTVAPQKGRRGCFQNAERFFLWGRMHGGIGPITEEVAVLRAARCAAKQALRRPQRYRGRFVVGAEHA
jgi:hypothetical protein